MSEIEFQDALMELLGEVSCMDKLDLDEAGLPHGLADVEEARSFQAAQVLTNNAGLVVQMKDGSGFQLTIVRSR